MEISEVGVNVEASTKIANDHIVKGLRDLNSVLPAGKYRIFGSLIPQSLIGPNRRIGDIDVLALEEDINQVREQLMRVGYQTSPARPRIAEELLIAFRNGDTQIQIMFGKLTRNGWEVGLSRGLKFYLPKDEWDKPMNYEFGSENFTGISPELAHYFLSNFENNPSPLMPERGSRAQDLLILKDYINNNPASGERINNINWRKPGLYIGRIHFPTRWLFSIIGAVSPFLAKKS